MSKEAYISVDFRGESRSLLTDCNDIIALYQGQGLRLTLRQLYYQLVSRNIIPNQERAYKKLGGLVSQGRLAGVIDWEAIEDRIRVPQRVTEWDSPLAIMQAVVSQYRLPRWPTQPRYVELWVEKDALSGVLLPISRQYHVTLMTNRGYSSQSAMKESAERLENACLDGREATIFYVGDLDPSGEDMVRDVEDRLRLLTRDRVSLAVIKLAITFSQVQQYNPPPNPTKLTDSRAKGFIAKYGASSYEADALPPDVLAGIVRGAIEKGIDTLAWEKVVKAEERDKALLQEATDEVMRRRNGGGAQ